MTGASRSHNIISVASWLTALNIGRFGDKGCEVYTSRYARSG